MEAKYSERFKAEVLTAYEQDGPSATARKFKMPRRTVQNWAKAAGIGTSATTKSTTEAALAAQKAKREQLRVKALDRATEMLDRMGEPMTTWVGSGATPVEVQLDRPPASVCRELAIAFGILVDKVLLESGEATSRQELSGVDGGPIEIAAVADGAREKLAAKLKALHRARGGTK